MYLQVAFFITLIRCNLITSPRSRLTLFVKLIIITSLSPIHVEKDLSLFEFFLTALNSASSFVVSNLLSIIILILADRALIYIIQPLTEILFLVNGYSPVISNDLLESNQHHPQNWSNLPADMISEIVDRLPNFKDIRAISAICNPWREACLEMKTKRPTWPWLMFSDTIDIGPRRSLNMCDRRHYQFELPTIHERRCLGSPHVVAVSSDLGCMNAAKWPSHRRPTRRRARDATACASNRVQFFFFFVLFSDSRRLALIRLRRAPTRAKPGQFAPIRA